MAAPTARTPQQSAAIDRRVNDLSLRGHTGEEIAAILTEEGTPLTKQAVSHRIKRLNARALADRADHITAELRLLDWAQREAMDAWEASKEDAEVVTVETKDAGKGGKAGKAVKRTEGRTGEPAHLGNVIKASESRRKLLGLDAPTKSREEPLPPIDWDRVPEDVQLAFIEGRVTLADVVKRLQSRG